jgi:hypothetical protein
MATTQQMREGEAELTRLARRVGQIAAEAERGAGEAMALPLQQRIARAQAGLQRAQALEQQARRMMRLRPNEGLRRLNDALARQDKVRRLLSSLQRPQQGPYR